MVTLTFSSIFATGGIVCLALAIIGGIGGEYLINVPPERQPVLAAAGIILLGIAIYSEHFRRESIFPKPHEEGETKGAAKEHGKTKP